MNDPYLSAWTTQYTNSPVSAAMSSTFEKTRPRRKARRSCMNCQRGHRTCDNQRPCEQCTKRGKQQTCIDGNHKQFKYLRDSEYRPTRRRRSQDGAGDSSEGSSPECIDPVLLHAQENPEPRENATMRLPREQSTSSSSSSQTARRNSRAILPAQSRKTSSEACESPGEGVFEDILAELLAYDTTNPPSFLNMPSCDEHEGKSNGFSISTGWSNTFFPPTECEVRLR